MMNEARGQIAVRLFVLLALTICLVVFSRTDLLGAGGQAGQKVIEKALTRNEVVQISEIRVAQRAVEAGRGFEADDEWLNAVMLKVKNISNKPIVFLNVTVDFPETKGSGSVMSYPIMFGLLPGSKLPQRNDPIFILPGDSLEIPLQQHYAKIKSFIEQRRLIKEIRKAEIAIGFVVFADKTGWTAGNFLRQDPNNPDHYINIGDKPDPNN
jgi:hypothetical protein